MEQNVDMNKKHIWQFDVLKCISCILVVLFHYPIKNTIGDVIIYAFRFPVPIFCMITGYFTYKHDNQWLLKKALYILKLTVLAEIAHGCIYCFLLWKGLTGKRLIFSTFPELIEKLFAGTFFNGTLWYLYGAFWTYLIIILFKKIKLNEKYYYIIVFALLSCTVIGRWYVQENFDINKYVWIFRNAFSMNLPLTLSGMLMAKNKDIIQRVFDTKKSLLLVLFGNILIVFEYFISGKYMDFHFSTFFISVGLFILAITYKRPQNHLFRAMQYIGKKWSMQVYIIHPFAGSIIKILRYYLKL